MQKITRSILVFSLVMAVSACSTVSGLFGGGDDKVDEYAPQTMAIGVNGYLWKATLETLSFMPFDVIEPMGGVISSHWHSTPEAQNERVKVTVHFMSEALRSDGVKVFVVRQEKRSGDWVNVPVQAATVLKIEEAILTQARRLRLAAS
jgi:Domain of unknown function (DUF3576)